MLLFIFESIGTSELLLVGIVALIFLGPRKLPEMAKKMGKLMAEFRGTANEFKQTWEREVNFEQEAKAFDLSSIENEPVAHSLSETDGGTPGVAVISSAAAPAIRQIDPATFAELSAAGPAPAADTHLAEDPTLLENDKRNWL